MDSTMSVLSRKSVTYLGPAFAIYAGCLDVGRWSTSMEAGSRFGWELVWVLVAASAFSALLQSLSARLGVASGRNLAQICGSEYPRQLCTFLWIQCEVSVLISDLTLVLGMAIALNAVLGFRVISSVIISAADCMLLLLCLPYLGRHKAQNLIASIMTIVLLCFTLEAFQSNSINMPVLFQGMFPKIKGEMLYAAAGILGANVVPMNFYLQSALIQGQSCLESLKSSVAQHNVIDIVTASVIVLVINVAALSTAVVAFHNSGHVIITLQDAQALMEQVLSNSVAPTAFVFAMISAGQASALSGTMAGQVVMEELLGFKMSFAMHRVLTRLGAIMTALFLLWSLGSEGTYQILIFSQVFLSLQLPFAIVPLLKATSSQAVMGDLKNSVFVEIVTWICTGAIYSMNIWVAFDMFFGYYDEYEVSGSWNLVRELVALSLRWGEMMRFLSLTIVVGIVTLSAFTIMWMISKTFKGEGTRTPQHIAEHSTKDLAVPRISTLNCSDHLKEIVKTDTLHESLQSTKPQLSLDVTQKTDDQTMEDKEKKISDETTFVELMSEIVPPDDDKAQTFTSSACPIKDVPQSESNEQGNQRIEMMSNDNSSLNDSSSLLESSSSDGAVVWPDSLTEPAAVTSDVPPTECAETKEEVSPKEAVHDVDAELLDKDDDDVDVWDNLEQDDGLHDSSYVLGGSLNSISFEEPGSGKSFSARSDASEGSCGGSGSGSLSRLSGLGRSARRQFAALLDEFWGKLYDLHGQPMTMQGKSNIQKGTQTDVRQSYPGASYKDTFGSNNTWYTSKVAQKSWPKNVKGDISGQIEPCISSSYRSSISDPTFIGSDSYLLNNVSQKHTERQYSSLRLASTRDAFDNQPATIHGYSMASYARSGFFPSAHEVSSYRSDRQPHYLSDEQAAPSSTFYPLPMTGSSEFDRKLPVGTPHSYVSPQYTKQASSRNVENFGLMSKSFTSQIDDARIFGKSQKSSYAGMDVSSWDPLVSRATGELDISQSAQREINFLNHSQRTLAVGERRYFSADRIDSLKSQATRAPLSFDELSPSPLHKDGFSIQSSSQNQSLWATQPFEQLFGSAQSANYSGRSLSPQHTVVKPLSQNGASQRLTGGNGHDDEVLNALRLCIRKLLRLDGSEWLFRLDSGSDEDLVGSVAMREKVLLEADLRELHKAHVAIEPTWSSVSHKTSAKSSIDITSITSGVPHCGEGCVWNMELVISFGVWCIHRVLELALMESRPELWGKYTYVLNRLQGVLDTAFFKPRTVPASCICLMSEASDVKDNDSCHETLKDGIDISGRPNCFQGYPPSWPWGRNASSKGKGACASMFLDIIKVVETAIGSRKGRTGTAAGDVAFPKGKENLASVLKRYKRRLSNRSPGQTPNASSATNHRVPVSSPHFIG